MSRPPTLSLLERDAKVIAHIGRLRFSPVSVIGGRGSRLIEEGGRELLDLSYPGVRPVSATPTPPSPTP
jgi:hypothetical protein